MFDVDTALRHLIQAEGSDLHLKVPAPPMARVHGHLSALGDAQDLEPADTERVLYYMLTDAAKLDEFAHEGEVDFAYSIEGLARFRVNAFRQRALRRVLRQDPDVILIGEMRDEETVQTALSAAETGHLVLSTVHTVDATESINRMLDFFPPHQHQQARAMIAGTLKGVVSQRLIPSADGGGRVAVCEILVMTGRVRDMIMDPAQTGRLHEVIQEGEYYGMQTFDQALLGHLQAGRISMEEALKAATHPHDFKLLVPAEGRRSTSMADVIPREGDDAAAPAPSNANGSGNGHPPAPVTPLAPVESEDETPE